jgi:autotransporter-associated beta strand protein
MTGAGAFAISTNGGCFQVSTNSSAGTVRALWDMSGLASATIDVGNAGIIAVGDTAGGTASGSILTLASNSTLRAGTMYLGQSSRTVYQTLRLGPGSNVLNVASLIMGVSRDAGQITFYTNTGSLKMRSADGAGRAYVIVGGIAGTAASMTNQIFDLGNHYADLLLSTLIVGEDNRGNSFGQGNYSSNSFSFSNGVLDATALRIGNRPSNPAGTPIPIWFNTANLGGGTVQIGAGGITMGTSLGSGGTNSAALNISGGTVFVSNNISLLTQNAATTSSTALGRLNITGGTVAVYGDILCGTGVANPAPHVATLILNGTNAVLDLTGHTIGGGAPANFVDVLSIQSGTLQNVAEINSGTNLVKTGPGLLTLAGTNSYTGATIVSNGTVNVTGVLGFGPVTLASGTTLGGTGLIRGPVTVQPGATLAPGLSGFATLSINNSLALQGTTVIKIARNGAVRTNDSILGSSVVYGGTVIVTNVGTSPLAPGDTFKLFSAADYSGAVANLVLPSGGYTWTNRLQIDGTVAVLMSPFASRPAIQKTELAGAQLTLTGTSGTANGTYFVLGSSNIAAAMSNWIPLLTNTFDTNGAFSNRILLSPALPQYYFLIRQ